MADYDVVVVEGRRRGRVRAVTAAEAGASVLVAEASGRGRRGLAGLRPALIMAAGARFQRERGIQDSPEALLFESLGLQSLVGGDRGGATAHRRGRADRGMAR